MGKPLQERPESPPQRKYKEEDKDSDSFSVNVVGDGVSNISGGGRMAMVNLAQWREDEDGVVLGGSGDDDCESEQNKNGSALFMLLLLFELRSSDG